MTAVSRSLLLQLQNRGNCPQLKFQICLFNPTTALRETLFDLSFSKRIRSLRLSAFRGNGLISVFKYSCMQTRQCECIYTYTGSVTDRRFVLQWASPLREREAKGWISFWNSNIKEAFWGRRWEESLIEGLSWWVMVGVAGSSGREDRVMSTKPPAGFILDYDEESENCTAMERGFCLSLLLSLSLLLPSLIFPLSLFAGSAEAFGNEMGFFMASLQGVSPCSESIFGEHLELIKVQ